MKLEVIFDNKLLWIGGLVSIVSFIYWVLTNFSAVVELGFWALLVVPLVGLLYVAVGTVLITIPIAVILTPVAWYLRARGVDGASKDEAVAFVFKCLWQTALWVIAGYIVCSWIGKGFRALSEAVPTAGLILGGLWMAYLVVWQPKLLNDERKRRNSLNVVDLSRSRNLQIK